MNQDAHEYEVLLELAAERGYVVQESEVELTNGLTRPCWLVYDLAAKVFVPTGLKWTTTTEVMEYILDASGPSAGIG